MSRDHRTKRATAEKDGRIAALPIAVTGAMRAELVVTHPPAALHELLANAIDAGTASRG
jgi:DNA mismatch repair ATPase MutL